MTTAAPAQGGPAAVEQLSLKDVPPPERELTIAERFELFHAEHPEVYEELRRLAFEAKAAGLERIGIRALWERLRWSLSLRDVSDRQGYRLNNVYAAHYARLLLEQEPSLGPEFFVTRELRS